MIASSPLVIGCSDQLPNELRAYHLMGTSTEGAMLLSRHGATYSTVASEVTAYPELLERMLELVLAGVPPRLRERARPGLVARWNRDWGVEAEDLVGTDAVAPANDNGSVPLTEIPRSPRSRIMSPPEPSPPPLTDDERVDQAGRGSFPATDPPPWTFGSEPRPHPQADDPDGGDERDRARRRRHID